MLESSFKLGKLAGVEIGINFSLLFLAGLMSFWMADGFYPLRLPGYGTSTYYLMGTATALIFFGSILWHEMAHALMAQFFGLKVHRIVLNLIGGLAEIKEPRVPYQDFWIALIGPLSSAILGVMMIIGYAVLDISPAVDEVLLWLGQTNLILAGFNILPGFPLDGGRVLRAVIWYFTGSYVRATNIAGRCGQAMAVLIAFGGIGEFMYTGNLFSGLWVIFIAWFLWSASQQLMIRSRLEYILQDISIREAIRPPLRLDWDWTLIYAIDMMSLHNSGRTAPVVKDDEIIGVFALEALIRVPRLNWGTIRVGQLMRSLIGLPTVHPDSDLLDTLQKMEAAQADYVVVKDNEETVAILGWHELQMLAERSRRKALASG